MRKPFSLRAHQLAEYVKSNFLCRLRRLMSIRYDPKTVLTDKCRFLFAWIAKQAKNFCWLIVPPKRLSGDSSATFLVVNLKQNSVRHIFNYSQPQIAFKPLAQLCRLHDGMLICLNERRPYPWELESFQSVRSKPQSRKLKIGSFRGRYAGLKFRWAAAKTKVPREKKRKLSL